MCVHMCVCVCVRVCPPPRLLITSGMMWCDMNSHLIGLTSSIAFIWQLQSLSIVGMALELK